MDNLPWQNDDDDLLPIEKPYTGGLLFVLLLSVAIWTAIIAFVMWWIQ